MGGMVTAPVAAPAYPHRIAITTDSPDARSRVDATPARPITNRH